MTFVLSAAGLYALMSFTVSQRTFESAVRSALGAQPTRVVSAVVRRALVQLGTGVALGGTLGVVLVAGFATDATTVDR